MPKKSQINEYSDRCNRTVDVALANSLESVCLVYCRQQRGGFPKEAALISRLIKMGEARLSML